MEKDVKSSFFKAQNAFDIGRSCFQFYDDMDIKNYSPLRLIGCLHCVVMVMTFATDMHIILLDILILLVSKLYTPYHFFGIIRS